MIQGVVMLTHSAVVLCCCMLCWLTQVVGCPMVSTVSSPVWEDVRWWW